MEPATRVGVQISSISTGGIGGIVPSFPILSVALRVIATEFR